MEYTSDINKITSIQNLKYNTPRKVIPVETQNKEKELRKVMTDFAVPDPKIVGKLPKGGIQLDFVGHADITRILIEVDPYWSWEPCGWNNGRPAIHVENGIATMWGWLTIHGKEMLGVGSVKADKMELDKELVGDFLRNASMRFGIALSLWTKQEWEDLGGKPAPQKQTGQMAKPKPASAPAPKAEPTEEDADGPLTADQVEAFNKACNKEGISPVTVYKMAKVKFGFGKQSDLAALRVAFKEAIANASKPEED